MIFQYFSDVFHFFLIFSGVPTSLVLHEKLFWGSAFITSVPLDLGGGLQKARRRGMGCTGIRCTPVVPVVVEDLWG